MVNIQVVYGFVLSGIDINVDAPGSQLFGEHVALSSDGATLAELGDWFNADNCRAGYSQIYKLGNPMIIF